MNISRALKNVVDPGLALLPEKMNTPESVVMLLTIGQQESRFQFRRQVRGPAHGFYQFESGGGVHGVLTHKASRPYIYPILESLEVNETELYDSIVYNDALATVCARLLLYTDPRPLPALNTDPGESWSYYIRNWRPGKPHRQTWDSYRMHAVEYING